MCVCERERTGTCKYWPGCVCACGDLCICKCVFGADGYSEGIVEAFWEACENAVKMSHCSWHRMGLMDCLHSQHRLCVCVCVVKRRIEWSYSRDTRLTTSMLLER